MLRKYLSDIVFMQVLNLLVKPIWIFLIDREVQNTLPASEYGNYFALFNFSIMFFILLDIGLTSYNITEVSRNNKLSRKMAGNVIGIKVLLIFVYLITLLSVGTVIGYSTSEFGILLWLALLQIITSFNHYFRSLVASWQKFKADGVFMVLDRVIVIILCAILIWGNLDFAELSIQTFIWAQLIGVTTVLISLILFISPRIKGMKLNFSLQKIFPMLRKSWPFALLVALMGLYNYFDGVMLKSLVGNAEAAEYALGYRLFYALLMFATIFGGVLLPMFSKHSKDRATTRKLGSYTGKLLVWVGLVTALVCMVYNRDLMDLLYPDKSSQEASEAFSILMFGFIGSALIIVFGTLLTAHRKLKLLNWAAFATVILNVILNLSWIPESGSIGAAKATLISQFAFGLVCLVVSIRHFNFQIELPEVLKQIVGIGVLFATVVYGKQYLDNIVVHLIVIAIASLITAYLFKLFEKKHFSALLQK